MSSHRTHFPCPASAAFAALLALALVPAAGRAAPEPVVADSTLTLPALERAVLERNPSLAAMRAALAGAEARARREGSLEDPRAATWIAPQSLGLDTVDPAWGVMVEQPLPLPGRRRAERDMARAERDAARQDLETARLDLLRETRRAYYDDYYGWIARETTDELLALMRRIRRSALARYGAGTAGQQDVLRADVEIAMLEHASVSAERGRRTAESRLRALLHVSPSQPLPRPPATLEPPSADQARNARAGRGAARWSELAAAEARIAARRAALTRARLERLPGTAITAGYERSMDMVEWRTQVGVALTLPLNAGRLAALKAEAQAELDRAVAERDGARDQLERRLTDAVIQLEESLHELEILRDELVPSTERAVVAGRAAYESGRGEIGALVESLRDHRRARLEYHRTLAAANDAAAELERALGGPAVEER